MAARFLSTVAITTAATLLALSALHHPVGQANARPLSANDRLSARLDAIVSDAHARGAFTGTVLVSRGIKVLLDRGYGANPATGRPYSTRRILPLPGSGPSFGTIALFRLAQQGRLWLDDPACRYLATCSAQLQNRSTRDVIDGVARGQTPAGALPALISAAADEPYGQYVERDLFWPNGMTATSADAMSSTGDVRTNAIDLTRWVGAMDMCSAIVSLQETESAGLAHPANGTANAMVDIPFGTNAAARLLPTSDTVIVAISARPMSFTGLMDALSRAVSG